MVSVPFALGPVVDGASAPRRGEPVTTGVPLPRGLWREDATIAVRSSDGEYLRVQARVLERWPDGSGKWVLLDFQADAPAASASYELLIGAPVAPPLSGGIRILATATSVVVQTGVASFHVAPGASFPFAAVELAGEPACDADRSGLTIVDDAGVAHTIRADRVWIDESGPLRAAVGVAARARLSNGRVLRLTARLEFFAGSAAARCALTLHNPNPALHAGGFWELGDPGSVYLRDVAVTFRLRPGAAGDADLRCSPETGAPMTAWEAPFEIYQDSSGGENWQSPNHRDRDGVVRRTLQGYRIRSVGHERHGRRATPIVTIATGGSTITVAMQHFWQNFPKAIEASRGSIALRLFPSQTEERHELQAGEQKTYRFAVAFGPDRITSVPLDWCRSPLVASVDPSWYASTGAMRHLLPGIAGIDPGQHELVAAGVDGAATFVQKRELIDEYGWRNFGDLYADHEAIGQPAGAPPVVSHYNNQYDAIAGFALQFMRTADRRWYELMADLAAHVVDIDIYHCDTDKAAYNGGLFWHTAHYVDAGLSTHRTYPRAPGVCGGGPSSEHNYTGGLLLHYFLTGEPQSRDAALGLAQWVVDMDDGARTPFRWVAGGSTGLATQSGSPLYHGPGRGAGNSLNALLDGFRLTGDVRLFRKAEEIIRRCIHPDDDVEARNLLDAERRWFYTVFLQVLARYLEDKIERGECDEMYAYARGSLLRYARWMADHEYPYLEKPELLEYPTETWAAQDIRKSDVFAHAAVHAQGAERQRFIERSAFFFRYSIDTLRRMATRALTRPLVLLLTNGWMYLHLSRNLSAAAPPVADRTWILPSPTRFVPQKLSAMRRGRFAAGAAAAAAVFALLSAWMGR